VISIITTGKFQYSSLSRLKVVQHFFQSHSKYSTADMLPLHFKPNCKRHTRSLQIHYVLSRLHSSEVSNEYYLHLCCCLQQFDTKVDGRRIEAAFHVLSEGLHIIPRTCHLHKVDTKLTAPPTDRSNNKFPFPVWVTVSVLAKERGFI
jgi:hypothetical protein